MAALRKKNWARQRDTVSEALRAREAAESVGLTGLQIKLNNATLK